MKTISGDAIDAWLFPPRAEPARCPRCGRRPRLVQNEATSRFECSGWFRIHCRGPLVLEGAGDGDYARNAAARAWNHAINAHVYPQRPTP